MATLTEISILTRKTVRYAIFGLVALFIGRIALMGAVKIYRYFFPPPPPPPTVTYGKLPPISFPASKSSEGLSFRLETSNGELPTLSLQESVYLMPKPSPKLTSLEEAINNVTALGYSSSYDQLSQTLYRFEHRNSPATLEYDIGSNTFSISFNLAKDSTPIEKIPPSPEVAISQVRSYISSIDLYPNDLTGRTTHTYLKIEDENLIPALSQSDSDLLKLNLFRKDYGEIPTVTPRVDESNVWFMIGGASSRERMVIAAEFHYLPVDEGSSSTYPLITSEEAWQKLLEGNVHIAKLGEEKNIVIRRIYLAHFDPKIPSDFFQPVIVFEGDDDFTAYLPAVTSDYYGE